MAVSISTSYAGEVLESFLTLATTGNEIVQGGHIYVKSGIKKKFTMPRIQVDNLIQDRKETPTAGVGTFTFDERALIPDDFMVYTEFNPREFEDMWRPFQPTGNLVFRQLPANVQVAMVGEIMKSVSTYMGKAILQGKKTGGVAPFDKFDGIVTKAIADAKVQKVATPAAITKANVISKLDATLALVPERIEDHPDLKIFTSKTVRKAYRDAIHDLEFKGGSVESDNVRMFKGKPVIGLSGMPADTILITYASANRGSNLWLGVDVENDEETIQVEKLQANSELYFFKMLMKADTQIAWGEDVVLYTV